MFKSLIIVFSLVAIVCSIPQAIYQRILDKFVQKRGLSATIPIYQSKLLREYNPIRTSGHCAAIIDESGQNMGSWNQGKSICSIMNTTDVGGPWRNSYIAGEGPPELISSPLSAYATEAPISARNVRLWEMRDRCNAVTMAYPSTDNTQVYFCLMFARDEDSFLFIREKP